MASVVTYQYQFLLPFKVLVWPPRNWFSDPVVNFKSAMIVPCLRMRIKSDISGNTRRGFYQLLRMSYWAKFIAGQVETCVSDNPETARFMRVKCFKICSIPGVQVRQNLVINRAIRFEDKGQNRITSKECRRFQRFLHAELQSHPSYWSFPPLWISCWWFTIANMI